MGGTVMGQPDGANKKTLAIHCFRATMPMGELLSTYCLCSPFLYLVRCAQINRKGVPYAACCSHRIGLLV